MADSDTTDVKVTILVPEVRSRRAPTSGLQPPQPEAPQDARLRQMPAQPEDVPPGYVWLGPDDGMVPYNGVKPQAGDLVAVIGGTTRRYATSPMAGEALRWPTFNGGCRCKCAAALPTGTAFYSTVVGDVSNLLALDVATGTPLQFFGANELGQDRGTTTGRVTPIAVDRAAPYDLYVLDDRRSWSTRQTDAALTIVRGYFTLVRYAVSAGQYAPVEYTDLSDPGLTGIVENDPPVPYINALSVLEGVPLISLQKAPARYLSVSGGVVTTHTLLRLGSPYASGLRSGIVTGLASPARLGARYAVATADDVNYELLEFGSTDVIRRITRLPANFSHPWHLVAFCNRLLILNGAIAVALV